MTNPTYTAKEIRQLCLTADMVTARIIIGLIDEEIHLYDTEDLIILCDASMILFCRTLLMRSVWL